MLPGPCKRQASLQNIAYYLLTIPTKIYPETKIPDPIRNQKEGKKGNTGISIHFFSSSSISPKSSQTPPNFNPISTTQAFESSPFFFASKNILA
jgi:hypothetical protein